MRSYAPCSAPLIWSKPMTRAAAVASSIMGISRVITTPVITIGRMIAVQPTIRPMLAMLEPMTLPKEMAPRPCEAAMTLTASSGALVPKATTVRPITRGETPMSRASPVAPRTTVSPPNMRRASPTASSRMSRVMSGAS